MKDDECIQRLYLLLFAGLPWSAEYAFGSWSMRVPSEPLMLLTGISWIFYGKKRLIYKVKWAMGSFCLLPIAISGLFIIWQWFCTLYASMPVVSAKYMLVETAQWGLFAVGMAVFPEIWRRALSFLVVSMSIFVVYTLAHHAQYHFRADQALLAPMPFLPDHTLYAAVLALLLPWAYLGRLFPGKRFLTILTAALLTIGLAFSTCRAAWLSLVGSGILAFFWAGKNAPWKWILPAFLFVGVAVFYNQISEKTAAYLHSDVSSMERLNRYDCARQMLHARPWVGFGPGTYQFEYLPFQKPENRTRISVLKPVTERSVHTFGRGGGAHSEYWRAAAEAGWPGFLLWLGLVLVLLYQSGRASADTLHRSRAAPFYLIVLISLLTFFLHGLVNNFLHEGIVAALVWGQIGYFFSKSHQTGRCGRAI